MLYWRYLICALLLTGQLRGESNDEAIEDIVGRLADKRFEVREKASDALMLMIEEDPEVAKRLEKYAEHHSPEVRKRIAKLTKDLPVTLKWMDPAKESEVKSLDMSPDRLKLTIRNHSKITINTYWIDWEGDRQTRRTLKPGQEFTYAVTYREHYWLLTDEKGKGLGLYCPGKKDAQIVYRGNEGKKD